jgi:hypothetical protein
MQKTIVSKITVEGVPTAILTTFRVSLKHIMRKATRKAMSLRRIA